MATLTYKGNVTIGVALPLFPLLAASVTATLPPLLVDVSVKVAALITATLAFGIAPPSIALDLAATIAALLAINASLALILPVVDLTVSISLGLIAKLTIQIAAINLARQLTANFVGPSAQASVVVAVYQGPLNTFGAAVAGALASALNASGNLTIPIYLPIFMVRSSSATTVQSMGKVFKTS